MLDVLIALLAGFLESQDVIEARQLAGGTYNEVWWVESRRHGPIVIKVAPDSTKACLTYEVGLMRNEIAFYTAVSGAVFPSMLGSGDDRWIVNAGVPGDMLNAVAVTDEERHRLELQLGLAMAQLHEVTGSSFGYSHAPDLQAATWPAAITAMFEALLDDAVRFGVELPVAPDRIRDLLAASHDNLATVTVPRLVHFDLWDSNLLVAPDRSSITLIDPERSFWGDPVADLVSPALFADLSTRPGIAEGYGRDLLDAPGAHDRLLIYGLYLFLIMFIESTPRDTVNDGVQGWLSAKITGFADSLSR